MDKLDSAYKTIGEVAKILKLKSNKKGILPTHTIRFWETQFKQIKPKILNATFLQLMFNSLREFKICSFKIKSKFFRITNEIPAVFLIAIIILVVFKPF